MILYATTWVARDLAAALAPLSHEQRVAFAAAVAERTLRVYWASFEEPDPAPRDGVELAWRAVGGVDVRASEIRPVVARLVPARPDLDEDGSDLGPALAAVQAVISAVDAVTDPFPTSAVRAAARSLEAAAGYVELTGQTESRVDAANDDEARWQREVVAALARTDVPAALRSRAQSVAADRPAAWFPYPAPEY